MSKEMKKQKEQRRHFDKEGHINTKERETQSDTYCSHSTKILKKGKELLERVKICQKNLAEHQLQSPQKRFTATHSRAASTKSTPQVALQKSSRLNKVVLADDSPPQKKFTATPVKGTATTTLQKTVLRKFSRQKLISDDSGTDYALKSPSVKLPVAQKIPQSEGKVTGGSSVKVKDRCSICRIVFNTDTDREIGSLWVKCGWDPCSYWVHATCCGINIP